jgi:hypothetical protein
MRRFPKIARYCLILGVISAITSEMHRARSQEERPLGQITVYTSAPDDEARLKGRSVMITILGKGGVASQSEVEVGSVKIFADLPARIWFSPLEPMTRWTMPPRSTSKNAVSPIDQPAAWRITPEGCRTARPA